MRLKAACVMATIGGSLFVGSVAKADEPTLVAAIIERSQADFVAARPPVDEATVRVDPDRDAPSPSKTRLSLRASAAGAARVLFGSYVAGGEGDVGVGIDTPHGSFGLMASFFGGTLEGGFQTLHGVMGFDLAWPIGIVRIGFQPRIGYIDVDLVTSHRQFGAYTFGLAARLSVDLVRDEGTAFALGIEPTADMVAPLGNDGRTADGLAHLLGGSAFLEVRWRGEE